MIADDLREVHKLIEAGFCRGAYARTQDGCRVDASHPDACKFCLEGAVQRVAYPGISAREPRLAHALLRQLPKPSVALTSSGARCLRVFSDTHTKAEVLALITRAITATA